jgi:hypothetical protein
MAAGTQDAGTADAIRHVSSWRLKIARSVEAFLSCGAATALKKV